MFCPLFYQQYNPYMMREIKAPSYIRVLHASPGSPGVDVYANGNLIAQNFKYKSFTPYITVPSGSQNFKIYQAGNTTTPIINTSITLKPNSIYTVAAVERIPNIQLFAVPEPKVNIPTERANLRFVHLSPDTSAVDVTLADGKILFPKVSYKGITDYIPIVPGRIELQARLAGTDSIILKVPNVSFKAERNYTVYLVGLTSRKPGLQVLIPLDGSTYLNI